MTLPELLAQFRGLPPGSLIPAAWAVQQLEALDPEPSATDVLDVAGLAARWGKSQSFARALLEAGRIEGAFKVGRKWQAPIAGVMAFEASLAEQGEPGIVRPSKPDGLPRRRGTLRLGSWRQERAG